MGVYYTCDYCGVTNKGCYGCDCNEQLTKKVIASRIGWTLINTFITNEYGVDIIYEQWQMGSQVMYTMIQNGMGGNDGLDFTSAHQIGETAYKDALQTLTPIIN